MTTSSRWPASLRVLWQASKDWIGDWFNQFILNFLVTLAWVTILLGPPALFGLYHTAFTWTQGQASSPSDLFRAARRYAWTSWIWAGINLLAAIVYGVNLLFYWRLGQTWSIILTSVIFLIGLFWAMMQLYVIPYLIIQKTKSLRLAFKNAFLTTLAAPFYTLFLFLISLAILTSSILFILPLILGFPALAAFIGIRAVQDRLIAYGITSPAEN